MKKLAIYAIGFLVVSRMLAGGSDGDPRWLRQVDSFLSGTPLADVIYADYQ